MDAMLSLFLMLGLMLKRRSGLICWLGDDLVMHLVAQPRVCVCDPSGCVLSSTRAAQFGPWRVGVMTRASHAFGTGQGMQPASRREFNRPIHDR